MLCILPLQFRGIIENKVIFTIRRSYFNNERNVLMAQWLKPYRKEGF